MASHASQASQGPRISEPFTAVNASLLRIAEHELSEALTEQERPMIGMYMQPTRDANAAFTRAVHVVCEEAHRLDVRPEEMLIVLKHAWAKLATTRSRHLGDRDSDVLRDVVTESIKVYFEARLSSNERH